MDKDLIMLLNCTKGQKGLIELNEAQRKSILDANLKVSNSFNKELINALDLDPGYTYQITGASSITGTPLKKYVKGFNRVLIKPKKGENRKKIKVLGNVINSTTKVLDLKIERTRGPEDNE